MLRTCFAHRFNFLFFMHEDRESIVGANTALFSLLAYTMVNVYSANVFSSSWNILKYSGLNFTQRDGMSGVSDPSFQWRLVTARQGVCGWHFFWFSRIRAKIDAFMYFSRRFSLIFAHSHENQRKSGGKSSRAHPDEGSRAATASSIIALITPIETSKLHRLP